MSGWLPPGCTDKDIDNAAPQNEPDDDERKYEEQLAREKRRMILRILGDEAVKEDVLWFRCWLSVMAHEIGWETYPQCSDR